MHTDSTAFPSRTLETSLTCITLPSASLVSRDKQSDTHADVAAAIVRYRWGRSGHDPLRDPRNFLNRFSPCMHSYNACSRRLSRTCRPL